MDVATRGSPVSRTWTRDARDLWQRIEAHKFENPEIDLDFIRRLARMLGWPLEAARAAVAEYRRFCFLACVSEGAPVTPSEEVDEVWHLHLTYTRDYWDWCGAALGRPLHHDPTAGGPAEQARYRTQYADTLALYESWFGPPPAAFWPGTATRFAARPRWRMVDGTRSWVLPRPSWRRLRRPSLAAALALVATPASAAGTWNPLDLAGPDFLALYALLLSVTALVTVLSRHLARATRRPADVRDLSPIATAYATGGMERAADTLFLELAAHGAARHSENRVTIGTASAPLPADLERFRAAICGMNFRSSMIEAFKRSAGADAMLADLRRRNVILGAARRRCVQAAILMPGGLLLLLGLTKIAVGLSRDRPVLFLAGLCLVTAIGLFVAIWRERFLTVEGADALAALRNRLDRAVRAPRPAELALAFAFGGAAVLAGTEHAAYGKVVAPSSSGGSGCGASGCGSGGGSGCGSGCGGCGS